MNEELKRRLFQRVAGDLDGVEAALRDNLKPQLDLVADVAGHLLFAGGKRFRPLIMVLCARLCGYGGDRDKMFSTAFEYIHAATLLHDDVVDGATLRRGSPVAHRVYDGATAVLTGDFLLARALSIGAATGRLKVIEVLAEVTEHMSQGEIHQLTRKGFLSLTEDEYMDVIRRKTAMLIQGACRVGAIIADAPADREAALGDYGMSIGLAFQMADDMLDYTAATGDLGKAAGADLREGKVTLPLIAALRQAGEADRRRLADVVKNPDFTGEEFGELLEIIERCGGIDYTRKKAAALVERAKASLAGFPESETRDLLLQVADFALARGA